MLIGIDVGTTAVKANLFDMAGRQVDSLNAPHPTIRNKPGYAEQDPDIWVAAIGSAFEQFARAHDPAQVRAIGICAQVNTHVFVDKAGNALAPAILWQDGRCGDVAAELDQQIPDDDRIKWWGAALPIDASHMLARMKWMSVHQPDIWEKTRWVMQPKDYCLMKLTGEVVGDPLSNVGFVDSTLRYVPPLLARVPGAADRLVPLRNITDVAGAVRPGQPFAGRPVCTGTMDAWAGMIGVGVQNNGQAMYLSGTSEILGLISPDRHPAPGVIVFPTYDRIVLHAGPTQSGGAAVKWFCDTFGTSPEDMATRVVALDPDQPCPLFLPHLQGERAPLWDIDARGTFIGVDASTGAAEFARAVYEGVACSARWLFETLETSAGSRFDVLNCGGGGFQSDVWNQIRADVLNRTLRRLAVKDPGVLGAVGLAAVACGAHVSLADALEDLVHFDKTYEPNRQRTAHYDHLFALFQETYAANASINKRLNALY